MGFCLIHGIVLRWPSLGSITGLCQLTNGIENLGSGITAGLNGIANIRGAGLFLAFGVNMRTDPRSACHNSEEVLSWALLHDFVAHPLMAVTFYSDWSVRFHDWTSFKAWPR